MPQFNSWQEVWSVEVAEKHRLLLRVWDTGVIHQLEMPRQWQARGWLVPAVLLCSRGCDVLLQWLLEASCTAAGRSQLCSATVCCLTISALDIQVRLRSREVSSLMGTAVNRSSPFSGLSLLWGYVYLIAASMLKSSAVPWWVLYKHAQCSPSQAKQIHGEKGVKNIYKKWDVQRQLNWLAC